MKKLSIKELANATGQKEATIRQHILRKLIIKGKDGLIDVDKDKNKSYVNEKTQGKGLYATIVNAPAAEKKGKDDAKDSLKGVLQQSESESFYQDIEKRKKIAELDVVERNAELKRMELEKRAGNLLPVEVVGKIFTLNLQSIFKSIEGEFENIASVTCGGDRARLASVTKQQREILDRAIRKAKEDALVEIENAIGEYQDTRGRGERK